MNLGVISYATGAVFFLVLTLVLLTGRRGRPRKRLFSLASGVTAVWAGASALSTAYGGFYILPHGLEILRDVVWLAFLVRLLSTAQTSMPERRSRYRRAYIGIGTVGVVLCGLVLERYLTPPPFATVGPVDPLFAGQTLFALAGLVLVEQILRNTRPQSARAIKYLCMGLGAMFAYDFYLYSQAVMLQQVDQNLWQARGFVTALVVPVLGVALSRDPRWSSDIFVSRRMVFHTAAILGASIYLLAMGAGGYYIRIYGGGWGSVFQVIFLFGAALILLILLFSGQLRATLRVLINKHFFHYKYDYRDEWLKFSRTLSTSQPDKNLYQLAIRAIAEMIESSGGVLWLRRESGVYEPVEYWEMEVESRALQESADSSLVRFLEAQEWVINLDEYEQDPALYVDLNLPGWLRNFSQAWLVTPLILHERLLGFVVLGRSPTRSHFNWEDCDLLKTACRQAASYIAQFEAAELLTEARQFEVCNRLSAYVMHDLKNLIAQLSLVVSNAARHKNNPQFMEDAISTVENSVDKMNRLLTHLRTGGASENSSSYVDLCPLLGEVVETMSAGKPVPSLDCQARDIGVRTNPDRFAAVIGHLIRNAQDATPDSGRIIVRLFKSGENAVIEVQDNGRGMDEVFIRDRLFRPFDSTKGNSGMGIGAFEAREFVNAMGGKLSVISRPDEGSTFRVSLPISDKSVNQVKLAADKDPGSRDGGHVQKIAGC